jgi:hypothetical protein
MLRFSLKAHMCQHILQAEPRTPVPYVLVGDRGGVRIEPRSQAGTIKYVRIYNTIPTLLAQVHVSVSVATGIRYYIYRF